MAESRRAKTEGQFSQVSQITHTTFADPMMGLSYECEPVMCKLETHFAGQIDFHYAMSLLVCNVHDFIMPEDYATIVDIRPTMQLDEI